MLNMVRVCGQRALLMLICFLQAAAAGGIPAANTKPNLTANTKENFNPSTPPDPQADAAAALCAKGPKYFTEETARALSDKPEIAAQARQNLQLAAHAGYPRGFRGQARDGNSATQAFYSLLNDREVIQVGEFWRKALLDPNTNPELIKTYVRQYSSPSKPAKAIGPLSKAAVDEAVRQRNPETFRTILIERQALRPPDKMDWQAGTNATGAVHAFARSADLPEFVSWIAVAMSGAAGVVYLYIRLRH